MEGNPVNYSDPTGQCIFTGVDTVACLTALAVGIPIIAGTVTAAWDATVNQGVGWFGKHIGCIDWEQVLDAWKRWFLLERPSSEGRTIL